MYDLLYSSIFGLGVMAKRLPNGQFTQINETLAILERTCQDDLSQAEDDDELEKRKCLVDNSISCLGKISLF